MKALKVYNMASEWLTNTICLLIPGICQAIVDDYHEEVIKTPTTPQDWMVVANQMSRRWQYHHCLAAIDGKHVAIHKLRNWILLFQLQEYSLNIDDGPGGW